MESQAIHQEKVTAIRVSDLKYKEERGTENKRQRTYQDKKLRGFAVKD